MESPKYTILVIAAEEPLVKLVTRVLADPQYAVAGTTLPEEALRVLETLHVDLLITEVGLNGKSGPKVAETVRRKMGPHHKVIYLSGITAKDHHRVIREVEGGHAWFLRKPFKAQELIDLARKALEANSAE